MSSSRRRYQSDTAARPPSVIDILSRVSHCCRTADTVGQLLSDVTETLRLLTSFDAATCYLYDQVKDRLVEAWTFGHRIDVLGFLSMGQGAGISGWTAQYNKPILFTDRSNNVDFNPETDFATVLSLPLTGTGHALGAVNLAYNLPNAVSEDDLRTLEAVSSLIASFIELRACRDQLREMQTKRDELTRQLETAQRQPSPLLSAEVNNLLIVQNHRINDPLSVIVGNVQCLLEEQAVVNQKGISRLRRIEEAALRIGEVIRDPLRRNKEVPDKVIG